MINSITCPRCIAGDLPADGRYHAFGCCSEHEYGIDAVCNDIERERNRESDFPAGTDTWNVFELLATDCPDPIAPQLPFASVTVPSLLVVVSVATTAEASFQSFRSVTTMAFVAPVLSGAFIAPFAA